MLKKMRKGLTLVELCIALAIMGLVTALAISVLSLGIRGFSATRQVLEVTMQDADFASRICSAVRDSGTSFTIPERSFINENLTAGWNYLGLMHGVDVPAQFSRTGKAIPDADALVYIEWYGEEEPSVLPLNTVPVHNDDGWFLLSILGHSYTDVSGVTHDYSLVFSPTDPANHAAQTISYSFQSSTDNGASIETLLEAVNAIQVVYQGSPTNPATAIAFRSDFIPTLSVSSVSSNKIKGTVVLVLDVSSSMESGGRINTLKTTAKSFLQELSLNNELNILITTFSDFASKPGDFSISNPLLTLANASDDADRLQKTVSAIKTHQSTNLGDGLRVAYYEMAKHPEIADYPIFLLVLTDGEVNACTVVKKSATYNPWGGWGWGGGSSVTYGESDFYTGSDVYNGSSFTNKYECSANYSNSSLGRKYFQYFGRQINEQFHPKTFLISMYDGMSHDDKEALRQVFDDTEEFNASSLTQFTEVFNQINQNIAASMWAFEGPRI